MPIHSVLACGTVSHSSTNSSGLVVGLAREFEQEIAQMVEEHPSEDLSPTRFRGLLSSLGEPEHPGA